MFGLLWEVFEGEFDGQFIFFSEVWAALNKLLRGHEPWQPPSSHGIHVKKKAKMRHTWRNALVLYRLILDFWYHNRIQREIQQLIYLKLE
jgi:hypothetical protein